MKQGSKKKLQDRLAYELWLAKENQNTTLQDMLQAVISRADAITFTPSGSQEFCKVINALDADPVLSALYNWHKLKNCS